MAIKYYDLVTEDWEDWYGELRRGTRGEVKINGAFKKAWDSNPCPHIHDQYGRHPGEPGFDRNNVIEFQPWTSTNSLPSTSGNYYLVNDVVLSNTWNTPNGTINICLNGNALKANGNGYSIITVSSSSVLNIYDCNTELPLKSHEVNDSFTGTGKVLITGGVITRTTGYGGKGSAILINGVCRLYGGSISGNYCNLQQQQNYGTISLNDTDSTFSLYGGEISYNNGGWKGGGVYQENLVCYFNLFNGKIHHNKAEWGGGLYIWTNSISRLYGGEISYNKNTQPSVSGINDGGGGVRIIDTGKLYVSGSIKIENNSRFDGLSSDVKFASSLSTANAGRLIINGPLTPDANIGYSTWDLTPFQERIISTNFLTHNPNDDPSDFFFSDDPAYRVTKVDGEVALTAV